MEAALLLTSESPITADVKLTGGGQLRKDGYTGKGIKVAVIDSGIYSNHIGFGKKVKIGKSYVEEEGGESSLKYHGTHVAGTIQ